MTDNPTGLNSLNDSNGSTVPIDIQLDNQWPQIDRRLDALATMPYRIKFRLQNTERAIVDQKGLATIRRHAAELISKRLAPAFPARDGKQTPYRGHPVFVAQHATATCCRSCLERWHHIAKGHEFTPAEHEYVVEVIVRWILRQFY